LSGKEIGIIILLEISASVAVTTGPALIC
jgi:hypothetical protein